MLFRSEDNISAVDLQLSTEDVRLLDEVSARVFPIRSGWSFNSTLRKTRVQECYTLKSTVRTDAGGTFAAASGPAELVSPAASCSCRGPRSLVV